jgi:hypothetical protein
VTLSPKKRLDVHKRYTLMVVGTGATGVSDTLGTLLDGAHNGKPGSDYVTTITAANLVLGNSVPGGPARLARLRHSVASIVSHESGAHATASATKGGALHTRRNSHGHHG